MDARDLFLTQHATVHSAAVGGNTMSFGGRAEQLVKACSGRPRVTLLSGIAIIHPPVHMGEAITVRTAGGFGPGI